MTPARRHALPALLILAASLTACSTAASTSTGTASQSAGTASWPSAAQAAARIGATSVHAITPTLYASDEATAVWHGRDVDIATFATAQLRDEWEQAAAQFTPILTDGPGYAVADDGPAA